MQPICMSFFHGVSTEASAFPLNATDIATQISNLFANPNGMVSAPTPPCLLFCNDLGKSPRNPVRASRASGIFKFRSCIFNCYLCCSQTGSLPNASFSADDISTMMGALTDNINAAIDGQTNYPWPS